MEALQAKAEFDEQERERIRRALRRYMEEHRIGTPTLQVRIIDADKPRHRELPLSTLQRFLTGSHRTSDAYVGMCRQFLEKIGAPLSVADFGATLVQFVGASGTTEPERGAPDAKPERFAGSFARWSYPEGDLRAHDISDGPRGDPHGELQLTPVEHQSYLLAREFAVEAGVSERAPGHRRPFEGVALPLGVALYIYSRDCLTRSPKTCIVAWRSPRDVPRLTAWMAGRSLEPDQPSIVSRSLTTVNEVQYVLAKAQEADHG